MKLILFSLLIFCLYSCKKSNASQQVPCNPAISYSGRVRPVFINNCTASGCHDGIILPSLSEYNVAKDAAQQIKTALARGLMPMNGHLSATDKAAIICWIDNGAKNN